MKFFLPAICLALSIPFAAFPSQNPSPAQAPPILPEDYVIGLEDILSINVWKEPELSVKEVVVRPDGKISVPLIGVRGRRGGQARHLLPRRSNDGA
jgi:polysaccharide export outer membrane protein